ncbi:MAG: Crp/Fnr family transcriptional regulator [Spirochaetes bacterium]|nr:Crp/Fnr family transcriptional regulator [Spirochaetota bacterium]
MVEFKLKLVKFTRDAMIYVEGSKNSGNFYIIKSGKVKITRNLEVVDDPSLNMLKEGDYFGVVACMSKRPRLETATALTDTTLISVQYEQFEELIRKNNSVALKILKLYSQKLRSFDNAITRISLKKPISSNPEALFDIGVHFYNEQEYKQARYAFTQYTKFCPNSGNSPKAFEYLEKLKTKLPQAQYFTQQTPLVRKYFDQSILFCEHEPGDDVFIIQQGKIKIIKISGENEILLAVLNPGDILGEMSLIENQPRSATAVAFGDVVTLVINKQNFMIMVKNQPQIVMKIINLLSERIWIAYRQLENTAIPDPFGRAADILLIQLEKMRIECAPRKAYRFDFGTDELVDMLGLDKEKGLEAVRKLLENSNFKVQEGKVMVMDTDTLFKMVEGYRKKIRQDSLG